MKKFYLFSTKPWLYLTELPPVFLLAIAIYYNGSVDSVVRLFPLIIFAVLAIVFIFIFFMRYIVISTEEIKSCGPYSTKETAVIKKGLTLQITLLPRRNLRVRLLGHSDSPVFSWSKSDDANKTEISFFNERAIGSRAKVSRLLMYFGIHSEDVEKAFSDSTFEKEYDFCILKSHLQGKIRNIRIEFTKTI